jgi:hypothetical protein
MPRFCLIAWPHHTAATHKISASSFKRFGVTGSMIVTGEVK